MSVEHTIVEKLKAQFNPLALYIENESHRHSSGRGSESHFKVTMISELFENKRPVACHQAVYTCLAEELANGVHALALHLYTPTEWKARGEEVPASTNCLGHGH
ncbi:BolA family protein [Glaesserella parasuis]|uniref:BolA family protein n=1 Tax=Glaesserella parasuis TaxID=738 RepID=UPI002436B4C6|nr:BolA/IbaG family iron-sulfur metabolism protein [Glaesserella parasuis]MDG6259475.1 BolA/IbaG family iron-sulfur metabolism protein [Glaesserella parasuis]MDG6269949.1 BolA/IbaG family iron-sulfur metabolism protein [Glaesserella parasuis]